jgi:hypothetical protein
MVLSFRLQLADQRRLETGTYRQSEAKKGVLFRAERKTEFRRTNVKIVWMQSATHGSYGIASGHSPTQLLQKYLENRMAERTTFTLERSHDGQILHGAITVF